MMTTTMMVTIYLKADRCLITVMMIDDDDDYDGDHIIKSRQMFDYCDDD